MSLPSPSPSTDADPLAHRMSRFMVPLCAGLALLVAKILFVRNFGNSTPYWDQWDAEAFLLYKPWIEGNFELASLLEPHNEHRIFTTRLLQLLLFELNGRVWNPWAAMYANAVIHTLAIVGLLFLLARCLPRRARGALWLAGVLWFSLPFGWDNALVGFQAQFFLFLALSVALLGVSASERPSGAFVGPLLALALVLTLASGTLAVFAAIAVALCRACWWRDPRIAPLAVVDLASVALVGLALTPTVEAHAELQARSFVEFSTALVRALAWPLPVERVGPGALLAVLVLQAPLALAVFTSIRAARSSLYERRLWVGCSAWFVLQASALAFARGGGELASRYRDVLAFGVMFQFAALLYLWTGSEGRARRRVLVLAIAWCGTLSMALLVSLPRLREEVLARQHEALQRERTVRNYLLGGDVEALLQAPASALPYPSAERLRTYLDDATIRSFLPAELTEAR